MSIRRFSSRTHRLDASFLLQHLQGARSYKRIAGYFTSSLFEVANELGVPLKKGYNGDLTSYQNGSVGGYMVKKMIQDAEKRMAGKQ